MAKSCPNPYTWSNLNPIAMDDFIAARSQMAMSLAFHIIFACIGMVMPFLMTVAHYRWLRTGDDEHYQLTRAWARGVAIFFVVGAVSGTMLSFELGLLFPTFMEHAGPIFGMPFSLEGTAFFLEAIALGLYLYGWKKLNRWVHWWTGVAVGIMGVASGVLVVAANAWMNSPEGFTFANGAYSNIDPVDAMFNAAWFSQALHMTLAAFAATSFAVAGLHAWLYLKGKRTDFHGKAIRIAMVFGVVAAFLQPLSGDISARDVAGRQPAKLAAMEAHFHTEANADLIVGGIVDVENEKVDYALHLPSLLSLMIHHDPDAVIPGLDQIPEDERPPVAIVHYAFQIMVGLGMAMIGLAALWLLFGRMKKPVLERRWFIRLLALATPIGFIALEAGWTVTEVGRQPWIIHGYMRTADAVTPMPGIQYTFFFFTGLYLLLSLIVAWLMKRQIKALSIPNGLIQQIDATKAPIGRSFDRMRTPHKNN